METLEKIGSIEGKSPSAFRTIGEVADELGLPAHVLRFWETKFSQIKPHKRRGGHRYYRPQDVDTLTKIKVLLHDKGFTIKGAQKYLSSPKAKEDSTEQSSLFAGQTPIIEQRQAPIIQAQVQNHGKETIRSVYNELCEIRDLLSQSSN